MGWMIASFLLIGLAVHSATAQDPRPSVICSLARHEDQCAQIQRGNSEVICRRVQDSIECAQLIVNGTADFGVFTAESALQVASLGWLDLTVVKELRHRDRLTVPVDFESVVVVKPDHVNGIDGLRGAKFCHPGLFYDRTQRWSELFLKHFERTVVTVDCDKNLTSPADLEAAALASHFSEACRPGLWSNNLAEDAELKLRYPSLCSLCNPQPGNCSYDFDGQGSAHQQALQCLATRGSVAYVSRQEAERYFQDNPDLAIEHRYLCSNGSLQTIGNNTNPCVWLRQPWKLILSSSILSVEMAQNINRWMRTTDSNNWEFALREIIEADNFAVHDVTIQHPRDYFRPYRAVPLGPTLCATQTTWCTSSLEEREKCEVVRAGGMTTGVFPVIECVEQANGVVGCLREINAGRSDLTGIDSNFGFLARHPYGLTTAMFAETESSKYSSVVVVIKTSSRAERFENLKGQKACFAEFGGIAAMSFINTGKNRGFFQKSGCHYGRMLSDFFGPSCAPGAHDFNHDPNVTNSDSLCSLCRTSIAIPLPILPSTVEPPLAREGGSEGDDELVVEIVEPPPAIGVEGAEDVIPVEERSYKLNCNADASNQYYGNLGALRCLQDEGDVAILELQYLQEHAATLGLNEHDFRVICRNGSLAAFTGFNVGTDCALTTIVDGEVVARANSNKLPGIINALSSFDKYFQVDPDFKMYNVFRGTKHLLFKDSTIGLVDASAGAELNAQVQNYKQLFADLEICAQNSTASASTVVSVSAMLTVLLAGSMLHF